MLLEGRKMHNRAAEKMVQTPGRNRALRSLYSREEEGQTHHLQLT